MAARARRRAWTAERTTAVPTASRSGTGAARSRSPEGVYEVRFDDPRQFLAAYHRDLSTGGLFIPTDRPAALQEVVTVELRVADAAPVRLEGRVVHRFEPGEGNLLAGMGVELMRFEEVFETLRVLAASVDQDPV